MFDDYPALSKAADSKCNCGDCANCRAKAGSKDNMRVQDSNPKKVPVKDYEITGEDAWKGVPNVKTNTKKAGKLDNVLSNLTTAAPTALGALIGAGINSARGESPWRGAGTGALTAFGADVGGHLSSIMGRNTTATTPEQRHLKRLLTVGGAGAGGLMGYDAAQSLFDEREKEKLKTAMLRKQAGRCWEGYEPVPGKEPYSNDSCRPKGKKAKKKEKKSMLRKQAAPAITEMQVDPKSGKRVPRPNPQDLKLTNVGDLFSAGGTPTVIPKHKGPTVSRKVPSEGPSDVPPTGAPFQPHIPGQFDYLPLPGVVEGPKPPPASKDYSNLLKMPELGYLDTAKLHTRDAGRRIADTIGLGDRFSGLSPNMQTLATLLAGAGGIGALGLGGYGLSRLFGGKDEEEKQPELKMASYTSKPKKNKKTKTKRKGSQMSSYTKKAAAELPDFNERIRQKALEGMPEFKNKGHEFGDEYGPLTGGQWAAGLGIPAAAAGLGGASIGALTNLIRGKSMGRGALTGGLTGLGALAGGAGGATAGAVGGTFSPAYGGMLGPASTVGGIGGGLGGAGLGGVGGYQLAQLLQGEEEEKTSMLRKTAYNINNQSFTPDGLPTQLPPQREPGTYGSSPAGQADLAKLNAPASAGFDNVRGDRRSALDKLTGGLSNAASQGADYSRQAGQFLADKIGYGDQFKALSPGMRAGIPLAGAAGLGLGAYGLSRLFGGSNNDKEKTASYIANNYPVKIAAKTHPTKTHATKTHRTKTHRNKTHPTKTHPPQGRGVVTPSEPSMLSRLSSNLGGAGGIAAGGLGLAGLGLGGYGLYNHFFGGKDEEEKQPELKMAALKYAEGNISYSPMGAGGPVTPQKSVSVSSPQQPSMLKNMGSNLSSGLTSAKDLLGIEQRSPYNPARVFGDADRIRPESIADYSRQAGQYLANKLNLGDQFGGLSNTMQAGIPLAAGGLGLGLGAYGLNRLFGGKEEEKEKTAAARYLLSSASTLTR